MIPGALGRAQTNIIADGFRSLGEGETVEFVVETSSDGRGKAVEVSGPNGVPVQVLLAHPLSCLRQSRTRAHDSRAIGAEITECEITERSPCCLFKPASRACL